MHSLLWLLFAVVLSALLATAHRPSDNLRDGLVELIEPSESVETLRRGEKRQILFRHRLPRPLPATLSIQVCWAPDNKTDVWQWSSLPVQARSADPCALVASFPSTPDSPVVSLDWTISITYPENIDCVIRFTFGTSDTLYESRPFYIGFGDVYPQRAPTMLQGDLWAHKRHLKLATDGAISFPPHFRSTALRVDSFPASYFESVLDLIPEALGYSIRQFRQRFNFDCNVDFKQYLRALFEHDAPSPSALHSLALRTNVSFQDIATEIEAASHAQFDGVAEMVRWKLDFCHFAATSLKAPFLLPGQLRDSTHLVDQLCILHHACASMSFRCARSIGSETVEFIDLARNETLTFDPVDADDTIPRFEGIPHFYV